MDSGQLTILFVTLDDIRHVDGNGSEYWYARELHPVLGYSKWDPFQAIVERAKISCTNSGGNTNSHFRQYTKMASSELNHTQQPITDIKLSRYACYFIALNGDPSKQEIAFAQAYFVTQTRKIEVLEKRMDELARLETRDKLKITEKEFSSLVFQRGVDNAGVRIIRSDGDVQLFGGQSTRELKAKMGVPAEKPLADFLPNVTMKAKDLAMAMTTENTKKKKLWGLKSIDIEHATNNKNIREALIKNDIYPENLPPAEDIEKIKGRHKDELRSLKEKQKLELEQASLFDK